MKEQEHINCANCNARCTSIFKNLTAEELVSISNATTSLSYKKGAIIFQEGAYPRGLYCIQSGKIKVIQTGVDGKEQIVHLAHDGNVMGYRAILGEDTYSCSALALEDSNVCFIPKDYFNHLVEHNGRLTLQIVHLLSDELRDAERRITHTAQQPVKNRLIQSLLSLKQKYGMESDNITINVTIKREELANLAGTSRETATRVLYELQEHKLIELVGKKIKIKNEPLLIELAHLGH